MHLLALLRCRGRVRLLLDGGPAVRQERQRPAVGREAGVAVVLRAERELAWRGSEPSVGTSQSACR